MRLTINDEKSGEVTITDFDIEDKKPGEQRESGSINDERFKKNVSFEERMVESAHSHSDSSIATKDEKAEKAEKGEKGEKSKEEKTGKEEKAEKEEKVGKEEKTKEEK